MRRGVLKGLLPLLLLTVAGAPTVDARQHEHTGAAQAPPAAKTPADPKAAKDPNRKKPENQPGTVMDAQKLAAAHAGHHEMAALEGGGVLPAGWKHRFDLPEMKLRDVRFIESGSSLQVTSGPPGIYWAADRTATGSYTVGATLTQLAKGEHREGYGLLVGGTDLTGPAQRYTYFLLRQDGKFLIKQREGATTRGMTDWTAHPAIKSFGPDGRMSNECAIVVGDDTVRFLINGTEVAQQPRKDLFTDGIVGLRINHQLDVQVDGLTIEPARRSRP